jgi:hypothetical protein
VDRAVLALGTETPLDPLSPFIQPLPSYLRLRDTRNLVFGNLPFDEMPGGDAGMEAELAEMFARATRALDRELSLGDGIEWPPSFPSASPVLALDRIYARGMDIVSIGAHASRAARRASDHLPVVARVRLPVPTSPAPH